MANDRTVDKDERKFDHSLKGSRVRLISTTDPYTGIKAGDQGTVIFVDGAGTMHVAWDSGGILGLISGEDKWLVI